MDLDAKQSVAACDRLLNLILNPRTVRGLITDQNNGYACSLKMTKNHPPDSFVLCLLGFFVLAAVEETCNISPGYDIAVSHLIRSPDIVVVVKAEENTPCHSLFLSIIKQMVFVQANRHLSVTMVSSSKARLSADGQGDRGEANAQIAPEDHPAGPESRVSCWYSSAVLHRIVSSQSTIPQASKRFIHACRKDAHQPADNT